MPPARAVVQLDKTTGEIIATFASQHEAARAVDRPAGVSNIQAAIKSKGSAYGFRWRYDGDEPEPPRPDPKEGLTKCSNCPRWRPHGAFIGARGQPVRRCDKCREKDARRALLPAVATRARERNREQAYYKAYRERKRAEDETAFLAHNAELTARRRERQRAAAAEEGA